MSEREKRYPKSATEMKVTWKKTTSSKRSRQTLQAYPNLPFDSGEAQKSTEDVGACDEKTESLQNDRGEDQATHLRLAETFQSEGNQLAEEGKFREALGKWEAALNLTPEMSVLHEQKAQILLEIGDAWSAIKAAVRATELEPLWPEAWVTLGRAQLNFGEPDASLESFDRALSIKPDITEAQADRETALKLVRKRKQLHTSGLTNATESRYRVGDKTEC
ncbi:hypothetical protein H6P81_001692 [Aristolochia fimbriata]|uniref:Tetratricopeptide repeat protein 33 n=1 Tax=Aristolochia fimbriata TaxID=158543 RepID=A0AAV7F8B5_ARIFI|nr:hypothetical protein H6P81_001692 [Aristolochia fimbriata]